MQNRRLYKIFINDFVDWDMRLWKTINNVIANYVTGCCYINELWLDMNVNWDESMMFTARDKYDDKWNWKQIVHVEWNYGIIFEFIQWRKKTFMKSQKIKNAEKSKNKKKTTIFQFMNQPILKKLIGFSTVTPYRPQSIEYSDLSVSEHLQDTNQVSQIESIHESVFKSTQKVFEWTAYRQIKNVRKYLHDQQSNDVRNHDHDQSKNIRNQNHDQQSKNIWNNNHNQQSKNIRN